MKEDSGDDGGSWIGSVKEKFEFENMVNKFMAKE